MWYHTFHTRMPGRQKKLAENESRSKYFFNENYARFFLKKYCYNQKTKSVCHGRRLVEHRYILPPTEAERQTLKAKAVSQLVCE